MLKRSRSTASFVEDIDKNADACTDFFDYANGAWRAANPIPASMQRWSRRWAAGEQTKEQLRTIVEDESKNHDWPKGSIDQQISDFYGACMDQARIDALGVKPIQPLLSDIDAIKTPAALQEMIAKLHELQMFAPFGVAPAPDNHNPGQVIARVYASRVWASRPRLLLQARSAFQWTREEVPQARREDVRARRLSSRSRAQRRGHRLRDGDAAGRRSSTTSRCAILPRPITNTWWRRCRR